MSRIFVLVGLLPAVFLPTVSAAQQAKKVPRIGFVNTEGSPQAPGPQFEAFRQGLRELGYIEGANIFIEARYPGKTRANRQPCNRTRAALKSISLSLVLDRRSAQRSKQPRRFLLCLSRPRIQSRPVLSTAWRGPVGISPGVTRLTRELAGKRLELLKEVLPDISRVGALVNETQTENDFRP